jgi:hypothetical protein
MKKILIFLIVFPFGLNGCSSDFQNIKKNIAVLEEPNFKFDFFKNSKAEELANSVRSHDTSKMRSILDSNPNLVDFQDPIKKNTLLILSVVYNLKEEVNILLEYKADPNLLNVFNNSAMFYAFSSIYAPDNCDLSIANLLVEFGGNINHIDSKSSETLLMSSMSGKVEPYDCFLRTQLLINKGADVNLWIENEVNCPVNHALNIHKYKIAERLLIDYNAQIPKFGKKILNNDRSYTYVSFRDYILQLITYSKNSTDVEESEKKALKNILNYIDDVK